MSRSYPTHCYTIPERLIRIGVPVDLTGCHLASSSEGLVVWDWMKAGGYLSLLQGENWLFETTTIESIKTLPLLVKTIMVNTPLRVWFTRTGYLTSLLSEREYKEFHLITSSRILVIGDFFEPSKGRRDCPLTTNQRGRIETMLLERLDQRKATIFQIHNPYHLQQLNYLDWWRPSVFDQLKPGRLKIAPKDTKLEVPSVGVGPSSGARFRDSPE